MTCLPAIVLVSLVAAPASHDDGRIVLAQTRPASSSSPSFNEPEPNARGKGWYYPNKPGAPSVGRRRVADEPSVWTHVGRAEEN